MQTLEKYLSSSENLTEADEDFIRQEAEKLQRHPTYQFILSRVEANVVRLMTGQTLQKHHSEPENYPEQLMMLKLINRLRRELLELAGSEPKLERK